MAGLARVCKMYGSMTIKDAAGNETVWVWDYKNDKARLESEMTKDELAESEKAKWMSIKDQIKKPTNGNNF